MAAIGVVVLYEATLLSGVVTRKRDFYVEAVRRMQTIHFECVGPFPCVEDKQGNAVYTKDILEVSAFYFPSLNLYMYPSKLNHRAKNCICMLTEHEFAILMQINI